MSVGTMIAESLPGTTQLAGKYLIGKGAGRLGGKVIRGVFAAGRWFRSKISKGMRPGVSTAIRAARGGSPITSGKLDLGGGRAFSAGRTAFNIGSAAKKAAVAAIGVGGSVALGKVVRPKPAVQVAMGRSTAAPRVSFSSSPASSRAPAPAPSGSSAPRQKKCGCPPGQRMLCFKRKHNPEAEAKRRAKRKAAREKSKAKTAKRTAKAKAASARRKSARAARGVRRALRGKR